MGRSKSPSGVPFALRAFQGGAVPRRGVPFALRAFQEPFGRSMWFQVVSIALKSRPEACGVPGRAGGSVPRARGQFQAPKGLVQETIICIKTVNLLRKMQVLTVKSLIFCFFFLKNLHISRKSSTFAPTNPTTPLNDAYHGGTSLFIQVPYTSLQT